MSTALTSMTLDASDSLVLDSLGEVFFRTDIEGRWTSLSGAWPRLTGCAVEDSLGRSFLDFVHPADVVLQAEVFEGALTGGCGRDHHLVRYRGADRDVRWVEARLRRLVDASGEVVGIAGTLRDVTERQMARMARSESDTRLRLAIEVAGLMTWERGVNGGSPLCQLPLHWGHARGSSAPRDVFELVHRDDIVVFAQALCDAHASTEAVKCECRFVLPNGNTIWVNTVMRAVACATTTHETELRIVGASRDVTAEREAAQACLARRVLLEATLEATDDGIVSVDLEGLVAGHNRRVLELWGIPDGDYVGTRVTALLRHVLPQLSEPEEPLRRLSDLMVAPTLEASELVRLKDGRVFERTTRPQWLDGRVTGHVWSFRDVSRRTQLETELSHQAYHDALTGLANRTQFRRRLEHALEHAKVKGGSAEHIAVMLVDLDGFKLVNDSSGHAVGDAVLCQVAERLLRATRGSDVVARLGGDEFGILLERIRTEADLATIASRITAALQEPCTVGGRTLAVGASIGISRGSRVDDLVPAGDALGAVDQMLRNADLALYEAKGRGKGGFVLFDVSIERASRERLSLEGSMRRGIQAGEFRVMYQPIVELETRVLAGAEVLVRWMHPERGLLRPADFLPLAEETGLIVPLGQWVLETACEQAARWARDLARPVAITVNVSPRQFHHHAFLAEVRSVLARTELDPQCLTLEFTEAAVIMRPEVSQERLAALKAMGVRVGLDDFGTGYSSLTFLQRFAFDELKIGRTFVGQVGDTSRDASLTSAIIALGQSLALRTVAVGVETAAQRAALVGIGCHYGQGLYFGQLLSPAGMSRLLAQGIDAGDDDRVCLPSPAS